MFSLSRLYAFLGLGLIAVAVAFLAPSMTPGGGLPAAHAGAPMTDCVDVGEMLCISLDPEADSNTVGDDHTVTATLTLSADGERVITDLSALPIVILVFDGPNAGESVTGLSDANGQLSLTYTGDGPGTDAIAAVGCLAPVSPIGSQGGKGDPCDSDRFISTCLGDPAECLGSLTLPEGTCGAEPILVCDVAEKEWVEPSPTSEPPEPTSTPEVLADVTLPETGGGPTDGGSVGAAWLAVIGGAVAATSAGAVWMAHQRRRVR